MLGYSMNVTPNTENITRASTQIFSLARATFILELVTVIIKSSTLLVSLLIYEIMRSLLRKHGIVMAMIVNMRIFIVKYIIVPLKYAESVCPGKDTKQMSRRIDTKRKLPEKPCMREPMYSGPKIPAKADMKEVTRPTDKPISTIKQFEMTQAVSIGGY